MKNTINKLTLRISICLCIFLYGCKKDKPDLEIIKEINIPKIDQFSQIASIKINKQNKIIVYSLSSRLLKYSIIENIETTDLQDIKSTKLSEGYRFLGFADKYLLTKEGSSLQVINLKNNEIKHCYKDFPYGNYTPGSIEGSNSPNPIYYCNYHDKSLRQRRSSCTNDEYIEFLNTIMSKNFLCKIDFNNDSIRVDTFLKGVLCDRIFKGDSYGRSCLGVEDFQDSICLYSDYSDSIYFYNTKNKTINPFYYESDLPYQSLKPIPYDLMTENYNEFIEHLSKDNLRYANIYSIINDTKNNLMHIKILHDKTNDIRDFSWLIFKEGKEIIEKKFSGELFDFGDSFIFNGHIYIKNKTDEKEDVFTYSIFDITL